MVSGRKSEGSDTMEESKRRPKYNLWQNSAFMLKTAWGTFRSVPFLCLALAATAAGKRCLGAIKVERIFVCLVNKSVCRPCIVFLLAELEPQ